MNKTVFSQLLSFTPKRQFKSWSKRKERPERLTAWEQFICMSFAQLTNCNGLREIELSFAAMSHKHYHLGLHSSVSRSNLSLANNRRSSEIFKTLAELCTQNLIFEENKVWSVTPKHYAGIRKQLAAAEFWVSDK